MGCFCFSGVVQRQFHTSIKTRSRTVSAAAGSIENIDEDERDDGDVDEDKRDDEDVDEDKRDDGDVDGRRTTKNLSAGDK